MTFKHPDDDGDLSLFVSGDEMVVVCNKGHAWRVKTEEVAGRNALGTETMKSLADKYGDRFRLAAGMD